MTSRILFPFSFDKDFYRGYSWTMELALRMNATIYFFTAVPEQDEDNQNLLKLVYQSLLAARGNYLQSCPGSARKAAIAKSERLIEKGDLTWTLLKFVKKTKFDIVVVDPSASDLTPSTIHDVVENSNGVIVLPLRRESQGFHPDEEITRNSSEDFFDVLRQSDCYQLQSNFFRILGQDKGLFNYLRYFFKKKGTS